MDDKELDFSELEKHFTRFPKCSNLSEYDGFGMRYPIFPSRGDKFRSMVDRAISQATNNIFAINQEYSDRVTGFIPKIVAGIQGGDRELWVTVILTKQNDG